MHLFCPPQLLQKALPLAVQPICRLVAVPHCALHGIQLPLIGLTHVGKGGVGWGGFVEGSPSRQVLRPRESSTVRNRWRPPAGSKRVHLQTTAHPPHFSLPVYLQVRNVHCDLALCAALSLVQARHLLSLGAQLCTSVGPGRAAGQRGQHTTATGASLLFSLVPSSVQVEVCCVVMR